MKYGYRIALLAGFICTSQLTADELQPLYKGKPLSYWLDRVQKAESDAEQAVAAEAIKAFGPDAKPAIPKLVEMLDDRSEGFRNMIRWVLCDLGPHAKSAVPQLVKLLKEKKARDPDDVLLVLKAIGPDAKEAVPVLIECVHDEKLMRFSVQALCSIGPEAKVAIPEIGKAIRSKQLKPQPGHWRLFISEQIAALPNLGPDVIPLLVDCLNDDDPPVQRASAGALAEFGAAARGAIRELKKHATHKDSEVRFEVAHALWVIGKDPEAISIYSELVSLEGNVGSRSIDALGTIGPDAKAALPALKKLGESVERASPPISIAPAPPAHWRALEAIKKIEGTEPGK